MWDQVKLDVVVDSDPAFFTTVFIGWKRGSFTQMNMFGFQEGKQCYL